MSSLRIHQGFTIKTFVGNVGPRQINRGWLINLGAQLEHVVGVKMTYIAFPDVVRVFVYVSGQAKVTDLHNVAL